MNYIIEQQLHDMARNAFEEGCDLKGVLRFTWQMFTKMQEAREHHNKRCWYIPGIINQLIKSLFDEFKELKALIPNGERFDPTELDEDIKITAEIRHELLDIANFCMFIYYNGRLHE